MAAKTIRHLQSTGLAVLSAFLTYRDKDKSKPLKVFQSLIFQLLEEQKTLRPLLHDVYLSNYRRLVSDRDFLRDLLGNLLQNSGATAIVIDGLDEIEESERSYLIRGLLRLTRSGGNVKLFISSRPEPNIAKELLRASTELRLQDHNGGDIAELVGQERGELLSRFREWGADDDACVEISGAFETIKKKSQGMILYAKLMSGLLRGLDNVEDIQQELRTLPSGLDQA